MENNIQEQTSLHNSFRAVRSPQPVSIPREAIEAFVRMFQNIADFLKEEEKANQVTNLQTNNEAPVKLADVPTQTIKGCAINTDLSSSTEYFDNLKNKFQTLLKGMSIQDFENFDLSIDTSAYISRLLALVQNPNGRNIDDWEVYLEGLLRKGREDVNVKVNPSLTKPVEIEWFRSFEEAFEAAKCGELISNEDLWKEFKFLYWVDKSTFKISRGHLLNVFPSTTTCIYQPHLDMGVLTILESENGAELGLECFLTENLFSEDFFQKAWFKLTPEIINLELADNIKIPLK
jgi:hypothetical protein